MVNDVDIVRMIEHAPLRTVRYLELRELGTNIWRTLDRLVDQGAVTRLAHGIYAVPPGGRDGRTWRPTLETAGLAVATARFGNRNAILMGLGAARHWAAIPRAIGVTTVAIPEAGRPPVELEGGGRVHLIPRDLGRLDTVLETTELGQALITTPAQTLYDLTMKPAQGGMPAEAAAAARNLRAQVGAGDLQAVMDTHGRANAALRKTLKAMTEEAQHGAEG